MSKGRQKQLDHFFSGYATIFNQALREEIPYERVADLYTGSFLEASPAGVITGSNGDQFIENVKKGYAFYRSIGVSTMEIRFKEITLLDEWHAMTKIGWRSHYVRKDNKAGSIDFENIYFTREKENEIKVFAYITGDEQAALKEHGLTG